MRLVSLLAIALLSIAASADGWRDKSGELIPDTPDRKSDGDFGASLLLVDDEEKFFKTWETPTPTVQIETATRAERNKFMTVVVIFSGCEKNAEGGCDLEGGFEIVQPDGEIYASIPSRRAWPPDAFPEPGILYMSELFLRIRIEPGELLGEYTVRAWLEDLMSGKRLDLESNFVAYETPT